MIRGRRVVLQGTANAEQPNKRQGIQAGDLKRREPNAACVNSKRIAFRSADYSATALRLTGE
jgi:hypothetical protein